MSNRDRPAVRVESISKRFGPRAAVRQLSLEVGAGEIFGLVGPDGCGKTTTMRILASVLRPDEGTAVVAGFDATRDPEAVKEHISYMPQRFGLYEDLTVHENIRFYADLFGLDAPAREAEAARLLEAAGMSEFRSRLAGKLSGGMKQKLGLACALIHHPEVILLDEPTTGVDPVSRRDFWRILYLLSAEGVTIVIATAYLDEAERCHRLALLHEGALLYCGAPAELKRSLTGTMVAARGPDNRRLHRTLEHAEGVASAVLKGEDVRLVVDDPERRIPEFQRSLSAAEVPFTSIAPTEPTVEDAFVSIIEKMRHEVERSAQVQPV